MRREQGMTLVEVIMAMVVLSIISTGMIYALITASQMNTFSAEQMTADTAIREKMAEIRANARLYTAIRPYTVAGDPQNYTGLDAMIRFYQVAENTSFLVDGLDLIPGETAHGTIILYLDEARVPEETEPSAVTLEETDPVTGERYRFGPKDLNSDGDTGDNILALGATDGVYAARIVPVEVRLHWKSVTGHVMSERRFLLVPRTAPRR